MTVIINGTTGITSPGGDTQAADTTINGLTVGRGAGAVATNTAVGQSAMAATATGTENTALGREALTALTSGGQNAGLGRSSLASNTTGSSNTGAGTGSIGSNTTGSYNTGIGAGALNSNTTASNNTAVGYQAGYSQTVADYNTFIGYKAGLSTTGDQNTFLGKFAGNAVTTGTLNTIIGAYNGNQGGLDIRTASNYIVLSDGGGNPRGVFDGSGNLGIGTSPVTARLHISYQTPTDGIKLTSNTTNLHSALRFQNPNGDVGYIRTLNSATQFVTSSDYRLKEDWQLMTGASERVKALNPVNFAWKVDGLRVDGFLAHEVADVVPEAVSGEKDAMRDEEYEVTPAVEATYDEEGNELTPAVEAVMSTRSVPDYQGIDQSKLVPLLTAALQEALAKIDDLTARVSALETA